MSSVACLLLHHLRLCKFSLISECLQMSFNISVSVASGTDSVFSLAAPVTGTDAISVLTELGKVMGHRLPPEKSHLLSSLIGPNSCLRSVEASIVWHIHCPPLTYPLSSCLAEVNPTIAYTFCSVAAQVLAAMAWWWKLESLYTAGTNSALCNNYHFIVCFDLGLSSDSGSGRGLVWKWDGMG